MVPFLVGCEERKAMVYEQTGNCNRAFKGSRTW